MPELRYRSEPSAAAGMAVKALAVSCPGTRIDATPRSSGRPETGPRRRGDVAGAPNQRAGILKCASAGRDQPRPWTSISWEWLHIESSFSIRPDSRKLK